MPDTLADLRLSWQRALGLVRRGMTSVRTRGWQSTWQRVLRQFRSLPEAGDNPLYFPLPAPAAPLALPRHAAPVASIVIPVFNQVEHTLTCLRALAEHPPLAACEVLVVDDGSSDQTQARVAALPGVRYVRRASNGGFIAACNDGAALATGEYLVFLNNDTVPQPGWLDALLATFASEPDAGLVGAQLLYPDGRLQEAGGLVFADASAWNYGRFEAPGDPRFASLRDADYCSGAALAIPRALFESLDGFDSRYAPAYYEDTDLAFAVRAAGRRVLYQPAARVVHLEGVTAGTDVRSGVKAWQVRNREVFARKWRQALLAQPAPVDLPSPACVHARQRQVLVIDAMTPQPDRDSASLRLRNLMRLLQGEGAHVVFIESGLHYRQGYTDALRASGVEVWCRPYLRSLHDWLRTHGARFDVVMLCRHYVAGDLIPLVRRHAPAAKVLFDTVDLHYLREARSARLRGDPVLQRAAAGTRTRELQCMAASDLTLVVSEAERILLAGDAPGVAVEVLSNLHELAADGPGFEQRHGLVFVGGFQHPPNVDAVLWFVREVLPGVRTALPQVEFHCIGADPPPAILALAEQPGVCVHGHVPDLAPAMQGMRVAVAPLRFGAGVKGKINLSMANGQPVVATACAVEGMHLRAGEDVLVADLPADFADAIVRLYQDRQLWERLARNGRENVQRHFSTDAAREVVRRVFL